MFARRYVVALALYLHDTEPIAVFEIRVKGWSDGFYFQNKLQRQDWHDIASCTQTADEEFCGIYKRDFPSSG